MTLELSSTFPQEEIMCTALPPLIVLQEDPSSGKARWYFITAATIQGTAYWSMETVAARMRKGFDNKWVC
jgi:hypothetical protein